MLTNIYSVEYNIVRGLENVCRIICGKYKQTSKMTALINQLINVFVDIIHILNI